MLNLLIIDDMPVITDGLYDLFREEKQLALEVYRAYSAPEALTIMHEVTMDIVISDIKMPGLSGLQLLEEINRRWPSCKVIFLTSYHEFELAREAVILGGFDFILKIEGDERIIQAVQKAADEVMQQREGEQLRLKAQAKYKQALPSLQKEFLRELLQGRRFLPSLQREQFATLELPLKPDLPAYLLIARIDAWKPNATWSDKALLLYAVNNIIEEYVAPKVNMITIQLDPSRLLGLWQPPDDAYDPKEYARTFRLFYGTLETIQNTCRDLLELPLSFLLSSDPCGWEAVGEKLQSLELLMNNGLGLNRELLTTDAELQNNLSRRLGAEADVPPSVFLQMSQFSSLSGLLSSGKIEEFFELFDDLSAMVDSVGDVPTLKLECLHELASIFLGYINRRRMMYTLKESWDLTKLWRMEENPDWEEYIAYYRGLAKWIFEHNSNEQEHRSLRLIQEIQRYILDNLNQDLSLTRLGEQAHMNPTYLSRLYKQVTGKGISDDIMEARVKKAKALLESSHRKIHEIAEDIGYQSGVAFTRFFKKIMNMTPQEYRDMHDRRSFDQS